MQLDHPTAPVFQEDCQLQFESHPKDTLTAHHPGPDLKFDVIVKFFNKLCDIRGRQKTKFIRSFMSHLFKSNRNPEYVYGILRLIFPSQDRERGNYGAKEKSLAVILRDSLGLPIKDYERLKNYKNPSYHPDGFGLGNFPLIASKICQKFCRKSGCITIREVNRILDDMALKTDSKDQVVLFTQILKQCTGEQILWLIRIILKDTKLGIKTETVLGEYHPDAQQYYNLTNSLKEVSIKFQNRDVSLKSEIMLFHPIKPMLAGKKPLEYFDIQGSEYLAETKFDGQRLQVHMTKLDIKLFSRNGKDYTHIYKELIPILRSNIQADACVLDGEMLVLQKHSLNMVPFGLNKQVALDKQSNPNLQLCYKIFDVLWVQCDNEEVNLMEHELVKRKGILSKFVKEIPGKLEIVKGQMVSGTAQITEMFYKSIGRNEQGIILKNPSSFYTPNDRSANWIKLKEDYFQGLSDTLDLIIIGGYYGEASYKTTGSDWTDRISSFLLGVISRVDSSNSKNSQVVPFCKVGTGYSQTELNQLRNMLRKNWVKATANRPQYLVGEWKPKLDDRPDCYINYPQNSVILEVRAAQMIKSQAFGAQKTLRFPRVVKIRYDKNWDQGLNMVDLQDFIQNQSTKGIRKKVRSNDGDSEQQDDKATVVLGGATKKVRTQKQKEKHLTEVLTWFRSIVIREDEVISRIFSGKEFCVLNLKNMDSKASLEKRILQNGGITVQNPVTNTNYVVSEVFDFKYRALVSSNNSYQFVKPIYIQACIAEKRMVPISPFYLSTIPLSRAQYFNTHFDYFGDSYSDLINRRELEFALGEITDMTNGQIDKELLVSLRRAKACTTPTMVVGIGLGIQERVKLRNQNYRIQSVCDQTSQIIVGQDLTSTDLRLLSQVCKAKPQIQVRSYQEVQAFFL